MTHEQSKSGDETSPSIRCFGSHNVYPFLSVSSQTLLPGRRFKSHSVSRGVFPSLWGVYIPWTLDTSLWTSPFRNNCVMTNWTFFILCYLGVWIPNIFSPISNLGRNQSQKLKKTRYRGEVIRLLWISRDDSYFKIYVFYFTFLNIPLCWKFW